MCQKVVRPGLVYGCESWTLTTNNKGKVVAAEMKLLRRTKGIIKRGRINNQTVISKLNVKPIELVIAKRQLSWLVHVAYIE